jgi:uncharacterized protein (DUF2062 family)
MKFLFPSRDRQGAVALWQRNKQRFLSLLSHGMSPHAIALSVALGFVLGVFPILGCPTILCGLAAIMLRLNLPAVQFVNYLVYPLQIALLLPFIRLGERLFHTPAAAVHNHTLLALSGLATYALHTVAAWFCVCLPAGVALYCFLAWFLRRSGVSGLKSALRF